MAEEELTFNAGPDVTITVRNWNELQNWLAGERAHWDWLKPGDGVTDAYNFATTVQDSWNSVINNVGNLSAGSNELSTAMPYLAPLNDFLLTSDSQVGRSVLDIRSQAGDVSATFAYAFQRGRVGMQGIRNPDDLRGAVLMAIPTMGDPADIATRLNAERVNFRNSLRSRLLYLDKAATDRDQDFEDTLKKGKRIVSSLVRRQRDRWKVVQSAWQASSTEAITSIKAVENAYLQAMQLQAPVKYWTDKAKEHNDREFWAVVRLAIFFPISLYVLAYAFWSSGEYILTHGTDPTKQVPLALYVVISGGLAVLATTVFWIGRLLTKLYLSEHHLRNDAVERAVMTKTYLALTKENAAESTDKQIILNALFRGTPDGIVKEDGPSDLNIQALISKLLAK